MHFGDVVRHDGAVELDFALDGCDRTMPIVLVKESAVRAMYAHAAGEMHHEIGGYVLGVPFRDKATGHLVTYVDECLPAQYDSTPTSVTIHAESFFDLERVRGDRILVGWYHSHPRLGIFLSGTDVRNFGLYHADAYQVAIVVDPSKTRSSEMTAHAAAFGFFGWRSPGVPAQLAASNIRVVEGLPTNAAAPFAGSK